jgi:ribosomal protein S17E
MEKYMHTKNLKDSKHVQEILAGLITREVQIQELEGEEGDDEEDDDEDEDSDEDD